MLLSMISGHDDKDSASADVHVNDYLRCLEDDVKGIRIDLPREFFGEGGGRR